MKSSNVVAVRRRCCADLINLPRSLSKISVSWLGGGVMVLPKVLSGGCVLDSSGGGDLDSPVDGNIGSLETLS